MKNTRKKYSVGFKTKVVLEALKEQQTISVISRKYGVHSTQIQTWKRHFLANATAPFQESKQGDDTEAKLSKLYEQIGKLQVENEFLKKDCGQSQPAAAPANGLCIGSGLKHQRAV